MVLFSLSGKQVWPQVIACTHLRPRRVVLLHSDDVEESSGPAQRFAEFLNQSGMIPQGAATALIPHDDARGVIARCAELAAREGMSGELVLHFSGGNKLMATAAFHWAAKAGVRACYLERGNQLFWCSRDGAGELQTTKEPAAAEETDALDAVAILRCQLSNSEVEREGERIVLAGEGARRSRLEIERSSLPQLSAMLAISGDADGPAGKKGDHLELLTAAVLLRLGVPRVHRSLRLRARPDAAGRHVPPHAEFDLLFNWRGRLWLVDCKDRQSLPSLADALKEIVMASRYPAHRFRQVRDLFSTLSSAVTGSETKLMKEDLLSAKEVGGTLGRVVCVRRDGDRMPESVLRFAADQRIDIVDAARQFAEWPQLLGIAPLPA